MDHDLGPVLTQNRNHFEQIRGVVWPEVEHFAIRVLSGSEGVLDCMGDVVVGDPVPSGGSVISR
ncbi:MAG: hypothetical protein M3066_10440 [Actinomycetota bacterium]|nr:hypothetical protein [Actinomycetota bacterium]